MTPDEMKAIGLRVYQEVMEKGNVDIVDEVIAPDCIDISPIQPPGIGREGTEPLKMFARMLHAGLSDIHVRVHELLTEGNTGIGRITIEGTHSGEFFGVPATGKKISLDIVDIVKYREGKIREHYGISDQLGLLQQVGVIPSPDQAPA